MFFIGLFKKVVLADGISDCVGPIFSAPAGGLELTFLEAWIGVISFSLQLYFDFSGYSDMAIGLSRMFGIVLPQNFFSPYKSINIIEFWRRWHMTLSRFLRDYLYIPLGGNRKGRRRRYINMIVTMVLGGLWHGAGWTFIIWGALHGLYLAINHTWHAARRMLGQDTTCPLSMPFHLFSVLLTFLSVMVAWVFFRANDMHSAIAILHAMVGGNNFEFTTRLSLVAHRVMTRNYIIIMLLLVWFTPSSQQIMARFNPVLDTSSIVVTSQWMAWRPSWVWMFFHALIALAGILSISALSEFIYFRF